MRPKSSSRPRPSRKSRVAGSKGGAKPAAQSGTKTRAKSVAPRPGEARRNDTIPVQPEWLEAVEAPLLVSIPHVPLPPGIARLIARSKKSTKAPPPLPPDGEQSPDRAVHKGALSKEPEGAEVAVASNSKPANVEVRAMRPDDLRLVCDLNLQLGYSGTLEQLGARFESVGRRAGHGVFVALVDQRVVGWLHVRSHDSLESEPYAEITGLVVDRSARRRGVGRALVERACKWAKKGRHTTLRVRSNIERVEAHQFYPRLGFHVVKTQHNYALDLTSGDDFLE